MKYRGKYSLKENLFRGRGMGLLTEMQMGPEVIQPLAKALYDARGDQAKSGAAGEAFIVRHLNGRNLNSLEPNFPFADVEANGVFYSV